MTFEVWEGMIHGWQAFDYTLAEGQEGINQMGEFILQRSQGEDT